MDEKRVVYLEITSWIGMSIGATHYYGELKCGDKKVDLLHPLTRKEAANLNKESLFDYMYKAGENYPGYVNRDKLIKQAIKTFIDHFPTADILISGRSYCADPQEILVGPEDLKEFVNSLVKEADSFGRYEGDKMRMEIIFQKFRKFWHAYT